MDLNDIQMLYSKSLILYKGDPVFVTLIRDEYTLKVLDIRTQNTLFIKFLKPYIRPVPGRIGFVNGEHGCMYISRKMLRQYKIGLSVDNTYVKPYWPRFDSSLDSMNEYDSMVGLKHKSIVDSINNKYPTIDIAYKMAIERRSFFAFDKSFCIKYNGEVYYRDLGHVGSYKSGEIVPREKFNWIIPLIKGVDCESIKSLKNS